MNCCTECFQAKEIIEFIESVGTEGECDFCKAEEVKVIAAGDLGERFDPLIDLYEEADEQQFHVDESLADLIAEWNVFSGKLGIEKQNQILDEIRFGPITPKERPRGENVVDLMEALRKSVGGAKATSKAAEKPAKKSKKASPGQKEMLIPIAGKKPAKETVAKKPAARSQRKSA